jgi:hypothetical protein
LPDPQKFETLSCGGQPPHASCCCDEFCWQRGDCCADAFAVCGRASTQLGTSGDGQCQNGKAPAGTSGPALEDLSETCLNCPQDCGECPSCTQNTCGVSPNGGECWCDKLCAARNDCCPSQSEVCP